MSFEVSSGLPHIIPAVGILKAPRNLLHYTVYSSLGGNSNITILFLFLLFCFLGFTTSEEMRS